jgi:hypothetical protein
MSTSSGVVARRGFYFQDLSLCHRILKALGEQFLRESTEENSAIEFGIEAQIAEAPEAADWDCLERRPEGVVLEEVKSGSISKAKRTALWHRIRDSLQDVSVEDIREVVLTVNRTNPPANLDRWKELSDYVENVPLPSEHPRRVDSVEALVQEALWYLTDNSEVDACDEDSARAVLKKFEVSDDFSRDEFEEECCRLLGLVTQGVELREFVDLLMQAISRRGSDEENPARRQFTLEELLEPLQTLEQYRAIDPEAARVWRQWRSEFQFEAPLIEEGQMSPKPTERIQPALFEHFSRLEDEGGRLLIVGHGGLGKTYALDRFLNRQQGDDGRVLKIPGAGLASLVQGQQGERNVHLLTQVLRLGSFEAWRDDKQLAVALDAVEVVETVAEGTLLAVLSALNQVPEVSDAIIVASVREAELGRVASTQSSHSLPSCHLQTWSDEIVRDVAEDACGRSIGDDLCQVLGTPLLLELFVRTFSDDAPPELPQTRYGVLDAYWETRLLPGNQTDSIERRELLEQQARDVLNGVACLSGGERSVREELISEGALVVRPGGDLQFRHELLAEFAVAKFLSRTYSDIHDRLERLEQVGDRRLRWRVLRLLCEEVVQSEHASQDVEELLEFESLRQELAEAAGGLHVDEQGADTILRALNSDDEASRLVGAALHYGELSWAEVLAGQPGDQQWFDDQEWAGGDVLIKIADILELDGLSSRLKRELANRLATWSQASAAQQALSRNDYRPMMVLIEKVSVHLGVDQAVEWLIEVGTRNWRTRLAVSSVFANLIERADDAHAESLVELFEVAAGIARDDEGRIELRYSGGNWGYNWIEKVLLGREAEDTGLFERFPIAAISSAAELSIAITKSGESYPPFSEQSGQGEADYTHNMAIHEDNVLPHDYDATILLEIEEILGQLLHQEGDGIKRVWEEIREHHCVVLRLILLAAIVRHQALEEQLSIVAELLDETVLYMGGFGYMNVLAATIDQSWSHLSEERRQRIVANIEHCLQEHSDQECGAATASRLTSVVPREARSEELQRCYADADCPSPSPSCLITGRTNRSDRQQTYEVTDGYDEPDPPSLDALEETKESLEAALAEEGFDVVRLRTILGEVDRWFVRHDRLDENHRPDLTDELAEDIAHSTLQVLARLEPPSGPLPDEDLNVAPIKRHPWAIGLKVLMQIRRDCSASVADECRSCIEEVADQAVTAGDSTQGFLILMALRMEPAAFRCEALEVLRILYQPRALILATTLIALQSPAALIELVRRWSTESPVDPDDPRNEDFASELGRMTASLALSREEARQLVDILATESPTDGLCSVAVVRAEWLGGFALGLKDALLQQGVDRTAAYQFNRQMATVWDGLLSIDERDDHAMLSLMTALTSPLEDDHGGASERFAHLYRELHDLLCRILREGTWREVDTCMRKLHQPAIAQEILALGPKNVLELVEALDARLRECEAGHSNEAQRAIRAAASLLAQFDGHPAASRGRKSRAIELLERWDRAEWDIPKVTEALRDLYS